MDDDGKCNEYQQECDDFEHILYDCPTSLYIWDVTIKHINNIYKTDLKPSLDNIIIPNSEILKDKILEEREKEEITTIICQTLSELHWRLYKGKTRPEVSKLTPETRRNSPVAKLGQYESSEITNRLTDKQKLCNNFKPVYKNS